MVRYPSYGTHDTLTSLGVCIVYSPYTHMDDIKVCLEYSHIDRHDICLKEIKKAYFRTIINIDQSVILYILKLSIINDEHQYLKFIIYLVPNLINVSTKRKPILSFFYPTPQPPPPKSPAESGTHFSWVVKDFFSMMKVQISDLQLVSIEFIEESKSVTYNKSPQGPQEGLNQ